MNASKENARKASQIVRRNHITGEENQFVCDFLDAAIRKLPSEAAFKREKTKVKK